MKKILMTITVCGLCPLFAMNYDDISSELGNDTIKPMPKVKTITIIKIENDSDETINAAEANKSVLSILKKNNCSSDYEISQLVKNQKLTVTHRIVCACQLLRDCAANLLIFNQVNHSVLGYSEERQFPIIKQEELKDYKVFKVNVQEKKAILLPTWKPVVEIDDSLKRSVPSDAMKGGYFYPNKMFYCGRWADFANPVVLKNINVDLFKKNKTLNNINKPDPHGWTRFRVLTPEIIDFKRRLIEVAKAQELEKIEPQQEAKRATDKSIVKVETVAKPKSSEPIVPTRIMLLESLGCGRDTIVNYIYKISLDRMRNEFRWLVAPTLQRSDNRFAIVPVKKSK